MIDLIKEKQNRELNILELVAGAKGTPVESALRKLIEIYEKEIYLYTMYGIHEFEQMILIDDIPDLDIYISAEATVRHLILNKLK